MTYIYGRKVKKLEQLSLQAKPEEMLKLGATASSEYCSFTQCNCFLNRTLITKDIIMKYSCILTRIAGVINKLKIHVTHATIHTKSPEILHS